MPDKDFDKLFKDSFMDAEIEPSADLWGNIVEQLEPKKKRSFPILWAAASVAVVASVLLFTQGGEKVYLQGTTTTEVATVNISEMQTEPLISTNEVKNVSSTVLPERTIGTRNFLKREITKAVPAKIDNTEKNIMVAVQPSEKNEHLPIKKAEVKPLDIISQETIVDGNNQAKMIAQVDNIKKVDLDADLVDETSESKKGIRNVGDLVNYVVDKVDKRDKKLIKFDTDDDDNSSIIGLNIGFLKLNKRNNK